MKNNDGTGAREPQYKAVWPRGPRQAKVKPLAKRLDTLDGKKIAWLWDYVFRGNEVFEQLEATLSARYPGVKFVNWAEFGNTHGSDERAVVAALPEKLKAMGVDAVVSGMGC
ncbi:MAG: UGSC family (seleno)protein [Burkholderiales bacterium]